MNRINFVLPGERAMSFDTDDEPEQLAEFLANNYPDAQNITVQTVPERMSAFPEVALEMPALNFAKLPVSAHAGGDEEPPLVMPKLF